MGRSFRVVKHRLGTRTLELRVGIRQWIVGFPRISKHSLAPLYAIIPQPNLHTKCQSAYKVINRKLGVILTALWKMGERMEGFRVKMTKERYTHNTIRGNIYIYI